MSRHLIHIGFPKTGSTSLQAWFTAHPEIEHHPFGIAGHGSTHEIGRRATDPARRRTAWTVTSDEQLAAAHPPQQGTQDVAASRGLPDTEARDRVRDVLHRLFPDATILIVTRGFRDALPSYYSQYVRAGGHLTYEQTMAIERDPAREFMHYDAAIRRYREAFGRDRVWVLPFELLRDEPAAFIRELEARMGLAAGAPPVPSSNGSLPGHALYWYPRLSRLAAGVAGRLGPFGSRVLYPAYLRAIGRDGLRRVTGLLLRRYPERVVSASDVPAERVESFRGCASELASMPLYAPYAAEYLNDGPPPG